MRDEINTDWLPTLYITPYELLYYKDNTEMDKVDIDLKLLTCVLETLKSVYEVYVTMLKYVVQTGCPHMVTIFNDDILIYCISDRHYKSFVTNDFSVAEGCK